MTRIGATTIGLATLLAFMPAYAAQHAVRARGPAFEVQLTLPKSGPRPAVAFGRVGTMLNHHPAVRVGTAGRPVRLPGAAFENTGWELAARSKSDGRLWGVLMGDIEGPGATFEIVASGDGIRWRHVATVAKPNFNASLAGFAMKAAGDGILVMHLDEGMDPDAKGGYYHCTTADGGGHWTGLRFTGEMMPAVDQGDLEMAA